MDSNINNVDSGITTCLEFDHCCHQPLAICINQCMSVAKHISSTAFKYHDCNSDHLGGGGVATPRNPSSDLDHLCCTERCVHVVCCPVINSVVSAE